MFYTRTYFGDKRKAQRNPVSGIVEIEVPYLGIRVTGTVADISSRGVGVRMVSNALNGLRGQVMRVNVKITGWPEFTTLSYISRHVLKPKGRLLGIHFMCIPDEGLALIKAEENARELKLAA
jgi:hypothetical protein